MRQSKRFCMRSKEQARMRFQWNRILACSVCVLCLLWFGFGRSPLPVQAAAQVWQTQHDQAIALARAGEFKAAVSLFA